jgi:hypothetical protein
MEYYEAKELIVAFRQIGIIAYMTGILWLRRNPLSMLFSAISPFSILFVLFVVSNGQYTDLAIAGSLVMATVGYGLALGKTFHSTRQNTRFKISSSQLQCRPSHT